MEVILLERIEKLGEMGDVVNVKAGYARNYLLPQAKALRATPENRDSFESRRSELEAANAERRTAAEKAAGGIAGASVVLVRQASDAGQLYGSVRPRDIANALNEQGAEIDRTQVKLDSPIKVIGLHTVRIAVHPEVVVEITANVARSEDEAELQAQGKSLVDEDIEEEAGVGYEEALEAEEEKEEEQAEAVEAPAQGGAEAAAEGATQEETPEQEPRAP